MRYEEFYRGFTVIKERAHMTNPSGQNRVPLLLSVFVLSLIFHMIVGWQDITVLARNGFLCDDSFYAFKIAQNIAAGLGPTFDGVHATTGFQPLFVFLLVPIFHLFGSDLVLPIKIALTMSALFTALTASLLFLLMRRYVRASVALFVTIIWAFSPVVIKQGSNGLETSLALLLFASAVYYYVTRVRGEAAPSMFRMLLLGVMLGLAIFARVDEIFLLLALLLDYLFVLRARPERAGAVGRVAVLCAGVLIATAPWMLYYYTVTGSPVLDSGSATRFLSIAYAPFFNIDAADNLSGSPGGAFLLYHVFHSLAVLKVAPPTHVFYRLLDKASVSFGAATFLDIAGTVLGLILLCAVVYYFFIARRRPDLRRRSEINFLLVFSLLLMSAYSFMIFGFFFFIRYYYPIYFVLCIYCAFLIEDVGNRFIAARSTLIRRTVYAGGMLYIVAFALMAYSQSFRTSKVYCFYDVARWVQEHTDENDIIGAFQGGAIGYFSGRQVVNLDGKVNPEALEALKSGTLAEYLKRSGVDILLDKCNVIDLFLLKPNSAALGSLHIKRIIESEDPCMPGWTAYRILASGTTGGSGAGGSSPVLRRHSGR